jgi:hypothetical protein
MRHALVLVLLAACGNAEISQPNPPPTWASPPASVPVAKPAQPAAPPLDTDAAEPVDTDAPAADPTPSAPQ